MTSRTPAQYDWDRALFNDRRLSKHFTAPRRSAITHVTLHHMTIVAPAGDPMSTVALEGAYRTWQTREASANYGVSGDLVWQFVSDNDAAWADANSASNHSTLSIEHANSSAAPGWTVSDETMRTGARLVACLHRLYKLGRPTRKTVRVHQDYYATACPGPYMMARLDEYIAQAQAFYDGEPVPVPKPIDFLDPKNYPPTGPSHGEQITWIGTRLVAHGWDGYKVGPGPDWSDTDRKAVRWFQERQGWTGADADGYPGPETLRRLAAEPVATRQTSILIQNCASKRSDVGAGTWAKRLPILAAQILASDASFVICPELYSGQRPAMTKAISSKYTEAAVREGRVIYCRTGRWKPKGSAIWKNLLAQASKGKPAVSRNFERVGFGEILNITGLHLTYETNATGVARRRSEIRTLVPWIKSKFGGVRHIFAGDVNAPAGATTRPDDVGPEFARLGYHDLGMQSDARVGRGWYHLDRVFAGAGITGDKVRVTKHQGSDHPATMLWLSYPI